MMDRTRWVVSCLCVGVVVVVVYVGVCDCV